MTIVNAIWSFNTKLHRPQLLLIKRADEPLKGHWALPETPLRSKESAGMAYIRLINDKIGLQVLANSAEQLIAFTDLKRVTGTRAPALTYMAYSPSTPELHPRYGATGAQWSVFDRDQGNYVITHDQQEIILGPAGHLVSDYIQITTATTDRIKNKLDYQPRILRILGDTSTLRQTHETFAAFLGTITDKIDNPNFKKTRSHLSKEVGAATLNRFGWPPKLY